MLFAINGGRGITRNKIYKAVLTAGEGRSYGI